MPDEDSLFTKARHTPWNKGKLIGAKPPLRPNQVWSIRTRLLIERRTRDLALFNLAIDSKLRGCDVVALRVEDVAPNGYAADRATVRQKKTGRPVKFELTDQTRQAVDDLLKEAGKRPGEYLFTACRGRDRAITTRQYARLLTDWVASIGLDPRVFGTHSLRRTKATLIYRRTGNLRAVQLLLGRRHTAREQQAEARITYRFHPRFGEIVRVRRRLKRGGAAFLVVHQLDGTFACLPAWMTDEAASRFEIGVEPRFPLDVLCFLRNEADALLGFLVSESKTERPKNDAPTRESPAKPVRGRASVRRTACSSEERARDGRRGAAARDRGGAGKGGKRGERR